MSAYTLWHKLIEREQTVLEDGKKNQVRFYRKKS